MEAEVAAKSTVDTNSMCRMCHEHLNDHNSVAIFDDDSIVIQSQLKWFTGLEVSAVGAMPKKLCLSCRLHLEKSNLIRNKCKRLEAKMRKHFRLISAGRVSSVFDDDDEDSDIDETMEESLKIIGALTRRLTNEDVNGNAMQQIDLELEKQKIRDEERAICDAKIDELNCTLKQVQQELAEANEKISNLQAQLEAARVDEPSSKRKQTIESSDLDTVVLGGDLVSLAMPVRDPPSFVVLDHLEPVELDFLNPTEANAPSGTVFGCSICEKEFGAEKLGVFLRKWNDIDYDFCSNSCANWFDTIRGAESLIKDDYTDEEFAAWMEENGPAVPLVHPKYEADESDTEEPQQRPLTPRPSQNARPNPFSPKKNPPRRRSTVGVKIKQETGDLVKKVRGNACYTCKKNIVSGGLSAEKNGIVAHFCKQLCFKRANAPAPPSTRAIKQEMGHGSGAQPRFYCVACVASYVHKYSLKKHHMKCHPDVEYNDQVIAEVR